MTDRYEVEIIVFRHIDQSRNTPEQPAGASLVRASPLDLFPESPPAPLDPYADPLAQPPFAARMSGPVVSFHLLEIYPQFPDFVPLNADDGELTGIYARLERLDAYEPIVHRTWMQGARPSDEAVPFEVSASDAEADFQLSGTVTLYKERYVHLEVNLDLAPTATELAPIEAETEPWPEYGDVFAPVEPTQVPLQDADSTAFELRESRRIRGVNAQYFDHPQFGVIARVSEIDLNEEEE